MLNDYWVYYYSIGTPYEVYWYDSVDKIEFYRKAYQVKIKQKNYELWLQGLYNFVAIQTAIANALSKKPSNYLERPLPTSKEEYEQIEEQKREIRAIQFKEYLKKIAKKKKGGK